MPTSPNPISQPLFSFLGKISLPEKKIGASCKVSSSMQRKGLTLTSWSTACLCMLLLATNIPLSSQIRDISTKNILNESVIFEEDGAESPNRSQALAPDPSGEERRRQPPGIVKSPVSSSPVQLHIQDDHVVMDNGIAKITLSKPGGMVTGIEYGGIFNLLEWRNKENNRGYWDLDWTEAGREHDDFFNGSLSLSLNFVIKVCRKVKLCWCSCRIVGTKFTIIKEDDDQVELSFSRTWDPSSKVKHFPLTIDKRFIMLRGSSGFYSYAIYEHLEGWPGFNLEQTRIVFKLSEEKFFYMAISDDRQRIMPTAYDRATGQQLDYKEAMILTNPSNPTLKGEVDDKYQYSSHAMDIKVHGWICSDPSVGFWMITPSDEFRTGGPLKQELTSHVGPTTISTFVSQHYEGKDGLMKFQNGESWKKVFGPFFVYLNSAVEGADSNAALWEDAKEQMMIEVQSWPYSFPVSEDFPSSDQRGTVSGRLLVQDRYINKELISADSAYVGLALPGDPGSWKFEGKGYQFWTKADANGFFSIKNVREGNYNLYAWVPGFIGDYKYEKNLTITPGCDINLDSIVYEPPRNGPTLWEIGFADRTAAEFYIPDPNPKYINKLYVAHNNSNGRPVSVDKFRQYGLWERYTELYPNEDLVYTIGKSDYRKDWFFAHVNRRKAKKEFEATTWQVRFKLDNVDHNGTYTLRLAFASANVADLHVRVNDPDDYHQHYRTGMVGRDNAIARHGIHGVYRLFSVNIPNYLLREGTNTIFLKQARTESQFEGIMYDYIRLEGPEKNH